MGNELSIYYNLYAFLSHFPCFQMLNAPSIFLSASSCISHSLEGSMFGGAYGDAFLPFMERDLPFFMPDLQRFCTLRFDPTCSAVYPPALVRDHLDQRYTCQHANRLCGDGAKNTQLTPQPPPKGYGIKFFSNFLTFLSQN